MSIFTLVLALSSCNEVGLGDSSSESLNSAAQASQDSVVISVLGTANNSSKLSEYEQASFSKHVYFHATENKILIAYDFFPTSSDVCSQATFDEKTNPNGCQIDKTVVVPCNFSDLVLQNDMLSFNASVGGSACEDDIVVDLSTAEFTTDGLIFDFGGSLDVFDKDFEFKISEKGFVDSNDKSVLVFSDSSGLEELPDINLTDVYAKIIGKQTR